MGDLLVQVNIEVPKALSETQEELLRQLAEQEHVEVSPHRKSFFDKVREFFGRIKQAFGSHSVAGGGTGSMSTNNNKSDWQDAPRSSGRAANCADAAFEASEERIEQAPRGLGRRQRPRAAGPGRIGQLSQAGTPRVGGRASLCRRAAVARSLPVLDNMPRAIAAAEKSPRGLRAVGGREDGVADAARRTGAARLQEDRGAATSRSIPRFTRRFRSSPRRSIRPTR